MPGSIAIAAPVKLRIARVPRLYSTVTFAELDRRSDRIAGGLRSIGVLPGTRLALLVPPGADFVTLVFALLKVGAAMVLIDPGMGRRSLIRCLAEAEPEGFVAVSRVHAARIISRQFPRARLNVTVGHRWFWGGPTLDHLLQYERAEPFPIVYRASDDPAAIIFTTGSTGPPKGVLYAHGNFNHQIQQIRDYYRIAPGEVDLPCFPLFGLFNAAMGVTTVIPDMDPTRPARVDPQRIVDAVQQWSVTQSFASPAVWNRVGRHCEQRKLRMPSLRRVMSAGAPVPAHVLARMKSCIARDGEVHTPYGATEALPVASIAASEVLGDNHRSPGQTPGSREGTWSATERGAGVCVGRAFPGIQWQVIRIVDGPIAAFSLTEQLPRGQIGELIVRGNVVTRHYVTRVEANALGKIQDSDGAWHRMGDAGYLDEFDRFWFCGRTAHRVLTAKGPMYTIPCEAIINRHPDVYRSALVGVGPLGFQQPVVVVEVHADRRPSTSAGRGKLIEQLRQLAASAPETKEIRHFLLHPAFPVDIRHNSKIFREQLAEWATRRLSRPRPTD